MKEHVSEDVGEPLTRTRGPLRECIECSTPFSLTRSERNFLASLLAAPFKRCKKCRTAQRMARERNEQ